MIDVALNTEFDTEFSERGDLRVVTGDAKLRQQIIVGIREGLAPTAPPSTETAIEQQRSQIEQVVRSLAVTSEPINVIVAAIAADDPPATITYRIETNRVEQTLTVGEDATNGS